MQKYGSNLFKLHYKYGSEIVCDKDFEMKYEYLRFKCVVILLSAFILGKYNLIFVVLNRQY